MKSINIKEIVTAWGSKINPSPELKELAEKRLEICDSCESKDYVKVDKFYRCKECGCPLAGKSFSRKDHACPKNKWVDVENEYIKKALIKKKTTLI